MLMPGDRWILTTSAASLIVLLIVLQSGDGSAPPLAFWPLLNPVDLATVAGLGSLAWTLRRDGHGRNVLRLLGPAGLACVSMTVLRSVHHLAGVSFTPVALLGSMTAQTSLTVTWAVVGLLAMVVGTAHARRELWIGGAGLMAVVVGKLFLVDLAGVDSGARIVSFLGVGALLLLVGYRAPVPPRGAGDRAPLLPDTRIGDHPM